MQLQHFASYDIKEFSKIIEVNTLDAFIKNVLKYGKMQDPDIYDPLKYMGDCWEVFAEFFFKFFNGDHTLTYTANYEPNLSNLNPDRGIDGRGVSTLDGKLCVIQCKFKANPNDYLTNKDNISNVVADASLSEEWVTNGKNAIIFTSCKGVHPNHAMVNAHCISKKEIARRVDKNVVFWNDFKSVISNQSNVQEQS